ncbi:glycosyltransferase family 4 protein [Paenibacillus koleovorans]|uniref:glycosyltransferase family 4 protein n=1 Tax=Paenibacillus koleovorans TaxID=121608 RepID=UPI000FD944E8|nr:glycosyltransferase family 4 protein [Paenibacillus koleovorans]
MTLDSTDSFPTTGRRPIAIVVPGTFPIPSGRSSSVELVVDKTSGLLRRQHRIPLVVIGPKTRFQPARQTIDDVTYWRCPRQGYMRHVCARLRKLRPAIVQVENRPRFAQFLKQRLGMRVPVILSLHSTTFISLPHIPRSRLLPCLRSVDAILVNSQFLKEVLLQLDPRLGNKITVNHLGVDPERFSSRWSEEEEIIREAQLESFGWQGAKVVLFVGRLIPIKGVHHLLKAMPKVLARDPRARLLIVGGAFYGNNKPTPYVAELKKLAAPLGDAVRFVPYVPHEYVPEWFRLADAVIVPSAEKEAFGLVNVEAMASGVPVVATRAGGMREVIEHELTGLLADPEHLEEELQTNIGSLLENPEKARTLGENGRRRVLEQFTWEHTSERLADLYGSLRKE